MILSLLRPGALARLRCVAAVPIVLSVICPGSSSLRADAVSDAIDAGIEYLLGEIEKEPVPHWDEKKREPGQVALETYALVVAGVDTDHPLIRKNFAYLNEHALRTGYTYTISCYIFALDAAIAQEEQDLLLLQPPEVRARFTDDPRIGRQYRPYLEKAVNEIVRLQNPHGGWRYVKEGGNNFDNSNVQFAVLALGAGAKRRVPIAPSVWKSIVDHFLKYQQPEGKKVGGRLTLLTPEEKGASPDKVRLISKDGRRGSGGGGSGSSSGREDDSRTRVRSRTVGESPELPVVGTESVDVYARGWPYAEEHFKKGQFKWNMTCAGLSSLLLARENLRGRLPPDAQFAVNKAVRDGFGWLMDHWSPHSSYYGIYSLEKVADIGGVKLFAEHDWYRVVSSFLVNNQRGDGSWPGGKSHGENVRVATSFALLVLNRATLTTLMTKSQVDRIMLSGRATLNNDPNDRSWVYVPDLDTTMHYPTLLRMIRLRPSPKLVRFLKNIVDNYPEEWKGELIPAMAEVRDEIANPQARSILEGYLASITGHDYKEWEDYLKWHSRWERVMLIGQLERKDRIPDLLKYYKNTNKSFTLKKLVMWALNKCKAREALPLFLEDLRDDDPRVRAAAYNTFKAFFIDYPPPFDPAAPETVREKQIKAIESWYERQERKIR